MTRRYDVIAGLDAIVNEHRAARTAVARLLEYAQRDPTLLTPASPTFDDLRRCLKNLERTYLVRLFALFEEALRDLWSDALDRRSHPKARDLLDGCAAAQRITDATLLAQVHEVRAYRNSVLHGAPAPVVSLADAKRRLCRFFGWMPERW